MTVISTAAVYRELGEISAHLSDQDALSRERQDEAKEQHAEVTAQLDAIAARVVVLEQRATLNPETANWVEHKRFEETERHTVLAQMRRTILTNVLNGIVLYPAVTIVAGVIALVEAHLHHLL